MIPVIDVEEPAGGARATIAALQGTQCPTAPAVAIDPDLIQG